MLDQKQTELATTGLGLITVGAGGVFAVLPKLAAWAFGLKSEVAELSGTQVVVRALGFRDVALGLGLLATRTRPEASRLWLRLFALCMVGDVAACLLALRKPGVGVMTVVGGLSSVVFGVIAWIAGQAQDKEKKQ